VAELVQFTTQFITKDNILIEQIDVTSVLIDSGEQTGKIFVEREGGVDYISKWPTFLTSSVLYPKPNYPSYANVNKHLVNGRVRS